MQKIIELTPMPSPSTATTTAVKPGERRSERSAYLKSWTRISIGVSYSWRSATTGSTRTARAVGSEAATAELRARIGVTPAHVRGRTPEPGTEQRQAQRLADAAPLHVGARGAARHADAALARALRHRV